MVLIIFPKATEFSLNFFLNKAGVISLLRKAGNPPKA